MLRNQRSFRFVVVVIFAFLIVTMNTAVKAQTTLATGDMVFTGYQASGPSTTTDQFVFVPLVALTTGTVIKFTDNAWNSTSLTFNTNESIITYTTTAPIPAGREIVIILGPPSTATFTNGSSAGTVIVAGPLSLPTAGDQLIAYQGLEATPTFITGIHMNEETGGCGITTVAGWDPATCVFPIAPTNNTSMKPAAFTTDGNAIWIRPEQDNARFNNCAAPLGTAAQVRAAVNNYGGIPGNWLVNDNGVALPPWAAGEPGCTTFGHCGSWSGCSFLGLPTAVDGSVSGRITDPGGNAVAGAVVRLSGTQNRKGITDANGDYRFENVETNGFYSVTPSMVNYHFSPESRSLSQLGNNTNAAFTATRDSVAGINLIDSPEYFVRQHYLDFLGREPDESGFNFWSDQILDCRADAGCIERRTINVSAAYFLSIEFQQTGGLVDGLYRASYGRAPRFAEFMPDTRTVAQNVVVGQGPWAQTLAANKQAFMDAWVQRPAFRAAYDGLSSSDFVDALISHTGVSFSQAERAALVSSLNNQTATRAEVLREVAENDQFMNAKRNEAFVMMQYFGYLRRDPDASGYQFWLNKLNEFNGNFAQAEMVKAFIVSGEFRDRFPR